MAKARGPGPGGRGKTVTVTVSGIQGFQWPGPGRPANVATLRLGFCVVSRFSGRAGTPLRLSLTAALAHPSHWHRDATGTQRGPGPALRRPNYQHRGDSLVFKLVPGGYCKPHMCCIRHDSEGQVLFGSSKDSEIPKLGPPLPEKRHCKSTQPLLLKLPVIGRSTSGPGMPVAAPP